MTRNEDLASAPTEAGPPAIDQELLARLTAAAEALAKAKPYIDPELKLYTPEEAASLLGKTENWVTESIKFGRIPFTKVGRSPRLSAKHIRAIAAAGEFDPATHGRKKNTPSRRPTAA